MAAKEADVLIIGAGAVGTGLARELSFYDLKTVTVDRLNDVGGDASKSNSAIIHTGFDAPPDSLESILVVHANPMYDKLTADLDIPFKCVGALLVAVTEEEEVELPHILKKAEKNHVFDLEYLSPEQILQLEPQITPEVRGGLYVPRESIVDPFQLVVAQAENAVTNGAEFLTGCEVIGLETASRTGSGGFTAHTTDGKIRAEYVVNAAGLFADRISGFLGINDFRMHPRRGQFHVLDRAAPLGIRHIILPVPTKISKGKLLTPSVHGNWLIGPTAEDMEDKFTHSTSGQGLDEIFNGVRKLIPSLERGWAITQYDGLRPVRTPGGYSIRNFKHLPGYLELSGIRSTGITSSPAIAKYVRSMLMDLGLRVAKKKTYAETRQGIPCFREADHREKERLISSDPLYGNVVCRCETVTEAEVISAIRRQPGATDLDGIKRRVRAGLGRCQAGFCGSRIPQILARELNRPLKQISKKGHGSEILACPTKSLRGKGQAQEVELKGKGSGSKGQ